MDELELLKKDWKKQEDKLPKLSYDEIYKMMLKKSSSIVKWIFIISVLEFLIFAFAELITRLGKSYEKLEEMGYNSSMSIIASIISFSILIYFMTRFFSNYKKIQATDSAKLLMKNILKTRRTVKYYVITNLVVLTISIILAVTTLFYGNVNNEFANQVLNGDIPKYVVVLMLLIIIVIAIGLMAFVYFMLYGLLTRKLKKNYEELKKLEV